MDLLLAIAVGLISGVVSCAIWALLVEPATRNRRLHRRYQVLAGTWKRTEENPNSTEGNWTFKVEVENNLLSVIDAVGLPEGDSLPQYAFRMTEVAPFVDGIGQYVHHKGGATYTGSSVMRVVNDNQLMEYVTYVRSATFQQMHHAYRWDRVLT